MCKLTMLKPTTCKNMMGMQGALGALSQPSMLSKKGQGLIEQERGQCEKRTMPKPTPCKNMMGMPGALGAPFEPAAGCPTGCEGGSRTQYDKPCRKVRQQLESGSQNLIEVQEMWRMI